LYSAIKSEDADALSAALQHYLLCLRARLVRANTLNFKFSSL